MNRIWFRINNIMYTINSGCRAILNKSKSDLISVVSKHQINETKVNVKNKKRK